MYDVLCDLGNSVCSDLPLDSCINTSSKLVYERPNEQKIWSCVPEYPVTWISLCAFYPHPTGYRLTQLTLSTVEFCLVRSWSVSAGRTEVLTVPPLTQPGISTALVPILCHWTRSRANLGLFSQHPHFNTTFGPMNLVTAGFIFFFIYSCPSLDI